MAVKEDRRALDKLLKKTEREIKALVEFWENSFVDEKDNSSSEIPWISKWHLGHPLDLNDECLREDPSYDEERVEREALRDQSSEKSELSPPSSEERQPLKPYNFHHQSKQVNYVSRREEEEEESSPEGNSEEDWVPEEEESNAEEGEDTEEMEEEEDKEAEGEEELEVDTGPAQAEPQKKSHPKTVRSYRCPECDREFSNSSNMQKHLRIHWGHQPYGCHVCGKSYSDPSNLTKHQLVHKGERPHPCPICPKAFYAKNQLDAHMRRHQGIRPFACLECRSTFCSRADLLGHMKKTHVERNVRQPPVHCTDCDKSFARPRLLREHLKRHKNLACEDCGEVFAFKREYRCHRKLRMIFGRCEVNYRRLFRNAEHPEHTNQESTASAPQGVVAKQPVGTPAHAGSQKRPVGSTQAATQPSGTDRPSVSASSRLSTDDQVRPSYLASTISLKEPSHLPRTDVGASQRSAPLLPVTCPVVDHQSAEPSTLAQTPLVGFHLQDAHVV